MGGGRKGEFGGDVVGLKRAEPREGKKGKDGAVYATKKKLFAESERGETRLWRWGGFFIATLVFVFRVGRGMLKFGG